MTDKQFEQIRCTVSVSEDNRLVVFDGAGMTYQFDPLHAMLLGLALERSALRCDPQLANQYDLHKLVKDAQIKRSN